MIYTLSLNLSAFGEKSLDKGQIEYKNRRAESAEDVAQDNIFDFLQNALLNI